LPGLDGDLASLYDTFARDYRRGVQLTMADRIDTPLADRFLANVSRFGAAKAAWVIDRYRSVDDDKKDAFVRMVEQWQVTEAATMRTRARAAKQYDEGIERIDIFPNWQWLPSRSIDRRPEHQAFAYKIWPKDDPFWRDNLPGQLWNCKCDLQETDAPPTKNRPTAALEPTPRGLKGNPALTGKLISDDATFFNLNQDVWQPFINRITDNYMAFKQAERSGEYTDLHFDWKDGRLKGIHKGHNQHSNDKPNFFGEGLDAFDLEKECMLTAYKAGKGLTLENENIKDADGNNRTALDARYEGKPADIRSITQEVVNYRNALHGKRDQLKRWNHLPGVEKADTVILYFHDPTMYQAQKVYDGMDLLKSDLAKYSKEDGTPHKIYIKHVVCVVNGQNEVFQFDFTE